MSIWGKILGGAAGLAAGGPIGLLIGALAGHGVDKLGGSKDKTQTVTFTIGVIVLSAKMAKADGHVSRDEIRAFREVFHVPEHEVKNVARIWDRARREATGYEPYAAQLGRLFADRPAVLEELLHCLFHIAKADGMLHPDELRFLQDVSNRFGLSADQFDRIAALHVEGGENPYAVLGVPPEASWEDIRAAHRKLVRENHPDKLIAEGVPEEFIAMANEKMQAINTAYETLEKRKAAS